MSHVTRRDLIGWPALAGGLSALAGLLWVLYTPRDLLKVIMTANGLVAVPDGMQSEAYIAADGLAALLLGGIGLVLSIAIVLRWRDRPMVCLVLGVGCGLIAAVIFWAIATAVHVTEVNAFPTVLVEGTHPLAPRTVRIPAVYVLWPLVAALAVTVQCVVLWVVDRPKESDDASEAD